MNKTKQMTARRTAQRRRACCPLPSRSRLVLNEVLRFFFFVIFFLSSCVHTITEAHGVQVSPGCSSKQWWFAADSLIMFSTLLTSIVKRASLFLPSLFVLLVTHHLTLTLNIVSFVAFSLFTISPNFAETRTSVRCSVSTCGNYLE